MKILIRHDSLLIKEPNDSQSALINAYHDLLTVEPFGDDLRVSGKAGRLYGLLFALAAKYDVDLI